MPSSVVPPDYTTAIRELERTRAELEALQATRTFRWSRLPRELYRRIRRRSSDRNRRAARSSLYGTPRDVRDLDRCFFYHSIDLPRHGTVTGHWDLRPGIDDYLGHVDFSGKRVLEIGPASGFVTMSMERRGASVVSVELASAESWDRLPAPGIDVAAERPALAEHLDLLCNSYWLVHREFDLSAEVYFGDVRSLPEAVGEFDISFIGSVLLHTHDPIQMIISCAQRTRETLVVTDVRSVQSDGADRRGEPVAVLVPSSQNRIVHTWWTFSPEFFVQLLGALGFGNARVSFHEQRYIAGGLVYPMFTVVARRNADGERAERSPATP